MQSKPISGFAGEHPVAVPGMDIARRCGLVHCHSLALPHLSALTGCPSPTVKFSGHCEPIRNDRFLCFSPYQGPLSACRSFSGV